MHSLAFIWQFVLIFIFLNSKGLWADHPACVSRAKLACTPWGSLSDTTCLTVSAMVSIWSTACWRSSLMACQCKTWLCWGTSNTCFASSNFCRTPSAAAASWLASCCSAAGKESREASHCSGNTGAGSTGVALLPLAACCVKYDQLLLLSPKILVLDCVKHLSLLYSLLMMQVGKSEL